MGDTAVSALITLLGEQKRLMKLLDEKKEEEGFSMCQAIDELIQDGVELGVKQGEDRFAGLVLHLTRAGRADLIEKAAADEKLRSELYKKYGMDR